MAPPYIKDANLTVAPIERQPRRHAERRRRADRICRPWPASSIKEQRPAGQLVPDHLNARGIRISRGAFRQVVVRVDDETHRLVGDGFELFDERTGSGRGEMAADQHDIPIGDDHGDVGAARRASRHCQENAIGDLVEPIAGALSPACRRRRDERQ